ncbi:MAG: acyl-CoA dehydrogenase family protein, partial [Dehalococcoidia bacterium]
RVLFRSKTPGITVRPLVNMGNRHEFNEVFFEDVRVPAKNLVGGENRGWYVAMTLLDFERSSVASVAANRRTLGDLAALARDTKQNGAATIDVPWIRNRLADLWVETEASRWLSYRVAAMQQRGMVPNYEASIVKVLATESSQRIYNFGTKMLGLYGQLTADSKWARLRGAIESGYLASVAPTIYSGSNEIQRNVIATRGLGLPRD